MAAWGLEIRRAIECVSITYNLLFQRFKTLLHFLGKQEENDFSPCDAVELISIVSIRLRFRMFRNSLLDLHWVSLSFFFFFSRFSFRQHTFTELSKTKLAHYSSSSDDGNPHAVIHSLCCSATWRSYIQDIFYWKVPSMLLFLFIRLFNMSSCLQIGSLLLSGHSLHKEILLLLKVMHCFLW